MIGEKVILRHFTNGNGKVLTSSKPSIGTIARVYNERDESGNIRIATFAGDVFSVHKSQKGWETLC